MSLIFQRFPEGSSSYLPLLIGYKCGPRIAEAFALEWEDIDFERKQLSIRRQIQWQDKDPVTGQSGYWYFTALKYDSVRAIELS